MKIIAIYVYLIKNLDLSCLQEVGAANFWHTISGHTKSRQHLFVKYAKEKE